MKRMLMACTAIVIIAAPAFAPLTALAQDNRASSHRNREAPRERATVSQSDATQYRRESPRQPRENRPERPSGARPDRPDRPSGSQRPDRPGADRSNRPDRPNGGSNQNRPDRPGAQRPDRPGADRPNRPGRPNGGWNQNRDRHQDFRQRFNRDQWRRDWNRSHRNDWWRNDRRFRGFTGVRVGFYFAPGWGYYSVPRSYWNQSWREGQYLPEIFWRYRLDDWRTYGLGYPPAGTRWVYVDNSIYLIDEYDGYIIEVIRDAWRW